MNGYKKKVGKWCRMLQATYNTLVSMGPYYIESTFKWIKMALWNAPTRVLLDIQLEQMRLERNLSRAERGETPEEWKSTTFRWSLTNFVSHSFNRRNLSVPTSSALSGTKYFIVHNLLTPQLHPENVQFIPDCPELLCPETFYASYRGCEWVWWEAVHRNGKWKTLSNWKTPRFRNPPYEV